MSYRPLLVEFWRLRPRATQEQARLATGAPKATVRFVYSALVREGMLTRPPQVAARAEACQGF